MSGIYIHIPFCKTKCSYCDFYSVANAAIMDDFIRALLLEIELRKDELPNEKVSSIYFGGGTPSQLSTSNINRILQKLHSVFSVSHDCELTLEANPDDLNDAYLNELKQTSVNRLSIGIQSFDDSILKMMRRRHNALEGINSVKKSFDAGFENISIDLIYGIDGMSDQYWEKQIVEATSLPVLHLSAYHLGIEEGTLLYRKLKDGQIQKIDEKSSFVQYKILIETARKFGFEQYEISNFAKDNKISRHNSSYWNRTPYLGFGPSAHSLIGNTRIINPPNVKEYIKAFNILKPVFETDVLSETDIINETIMLGLRTVKGVNLTDFLNNFGPNEYNFLLVKTGKLNPDYYKIASDYLSLTPAGMFVSDSIISILFK